VLNLDNTAILPMARRKHYNLVSFPKSHGG
jgi:hypothetical protein